MFCEHCGNMLPNNAKFCNSCGAPVAKKAEPSYQAPSQEPYTTPVHPQVYNQVDAYAPPRQEKPQVSFVEAIRLYFMNYANFSGRARRSEYWYATLFTSLLNGLFTAIVPDLVWIVSLVTLVPSLAICIRRLHDTGKSGWYYLWFLLPIAGPIMVLIRLCKDSEGDNQWGASPKY